MAFDFDKQLRDDVRNVFLVEFSQEAIFKSNTTIKKITVQFFEEPLDKMGTQYFHAWCANDDIPYVAIGDTLEIASVIYGIVDFSPDEFQSGINLFLQKV